MKKPPTFIPETRNAPRPMAMPGEGQTIEQLRAEAQQRLRRINSDQCRVGEIVDILVAEVLEREKRLQQMIPKAP